MTIPNRPVLLDALLTRLGFPPMGYNPRRRPSRRTTTQGPRKTLQTGRIEAEKTYQTPIKTYGTGLEKSSDVYKTPGISEQRINEVQAEIAEEAKAEGEEIESITKTYEQRLEADRVRLSQADFNGIGLTPPRIKSMVAQWEAEQRALLRSLESPPPRPYNQQSPIKMGHSLRPST